MIGSRLMGEGYARGIYIHITGYLGGLVYLDISRVIISCTGKLARKALGAIFPYITGPSHDGITTSEYKVRMRKK